MIRETSVIDGPMVNMPGHNRQIIAQAIQHDRTHIVYLSLAIANLFRGFYISPRGCLVRIGEKVLE